MISKYLLENYYSKTNRLNIIPTEEQINQAILHHPDKLIIIRDGEIKGIAFFLTLTDETYTQLEAKDLDDIEILRSMCCENGRNFHFVLVCGSGYKNIRFGIKRALKLKPKTISWFSPDFKTLHKFEV